MKKYLRNLFVVVTLVFSGFVFFSCDVLYELLNTITEGDSTITKPTDSDEEKTDPDEKPTDPDEKPTDPGNEIVVTDGFVKIKGVKVTGYEVWTPTSEVFVDYRPLEIKGYYISDHEVTRAEYKAVTGAYPPEKNQYGTNVTPKFYDKNEKLVSGTAADNNPVTGVSFFDMLIYCNLRSMKENRTPCYKLHNKSESIKSTNPEDWKTWLKNADYYGFECDFNANGYRLPTEAEWEWAARARQKYEYSGSDTLSEVASSVEGTYDVKSKKQNGFGLYDMSGNAAEFCWDWYINECLPDTPVTGIATTAVEHRVLRGGSWHGTDGLRERGKYDQEDQEPWIGFRLAYTDLSSKDYEYADPSATGIITPTGNVKEIEYITVPGATVTGSSYPSNKKGSEGVFTEGTSVKINSFMMSKYEITQAQYTKVMKNKTVTDKNGEVKEIVENPSRCTGSNKDYRLDFGKDHSNYPVETVTYYDAIYFCNELSKAEGLTPCYEISEIEIGYYKNIYSAEIKNVSGANGYRLPTAEEWEFAARGGDPNAADWNYIFSGKNGTITDKDYNSAIDSVGWYAHNNKTGITEEIDQTWREPDGVGTGSGTHEVGLLSPNRLGLYDMTGNVSEMTHCENPESFWSIISVNGGNWKYCAGDCYVFSSVERNLNLYEEYKGFRIVRSIE